MAQATRRVGPVRDGGYPARPCADGQPGHPLDQVEIATYRGNYSAFNGYHFTPSDYSALRCGACGAYWRTKAAYVDEISVLGGRSGS